MQDEPHAPSIAMAPQASAAALFGGPLSGLYATLGLFKTQVEELRLDVDGQYPQMTASGVVPLSATQQVHWIAQLITTGPNKFTGGIWFKEPAVSGFAYTSVSIEATSSFVPLLRWAKVTFSGLGLPDRHRIFKFKSPSFHKVEFEFDAEAGIAPETKVATCAHPDHPATIPCETLSIEQVYRRTGFDVRKSGGDDIVPITSTGADTVWSNTEMHDAMQIFWSRFANVPQWSMWCLFARQHEMGFGLGGIMFDDIGPNHRQGTSLFYDSFISQAPAGDPNPTDFVTRMRFWTAVHEMGHAFNLAHSWQKSLGAPFGSPWIPLVDEPEARSFMNYPYNVAGGTTAFFDTFEYRFSDSELLFLRHAPERFVQMGNEAWFSHHGFEDAYLHPEPKLKIEVRFNRPKPVFEFLEPVVAELKLSNVCSDPQIVDENILRTLDHMTILIKRERGQTRRYQAYGRMCLQPKARALMPGEAMYDSVFLSAGLNGFDIGEPGYYVIQAAVHTEAGNILSEPVRIRVTPPRGYDEEHLAQDFISDGVGRVLAFDGSRALTGAVDTLRQAADMLADRRVASHARIALAMPLTKSGKTLSLPETLPAVLTSAAKLGGKLQTVSSKVQQASKELAPALTKEPNECAETLGHVDYKYYVDYLSEAVASAGDAKQAAGLQETLYRTLSARQVKESVLKGIEGKREHYARRKK
jgi:hypothetical protein